MTDGRELRPYQLEAVDALSEAVQRSEPMILRLPTGVGKTVVAAEVIRRRYRTERVLVLVHNEQLLRQWGAELAAVGVPWEVEQGQERRASLEARVVIGSVMTLARTRRLKRFARDAFDLVVVDECHHAAAPGWKRVLDYFGRHAALVGLTATPERLDGKALGPFEACAMYPYTIAEAIDDGWLSGFRAEGIFVEGFDVSDVRLIGRGDTKDLDAKQIAKVATASKALDGVVGPLLERIGSRRTLLFAASVEHAQLLAERLNGKRPGSADAVWGTDRDRDAKLERFAAGEVQVMVNVMLLVEGYDDPGIECIASARPTRSRALYTQMLGRGLRLHPGKEGLLVIDFCGNAGRHLEGIVHAADVVAPVERPEVLRAAEAQMAAAEGMTFNEALAIARKLPERALVKYRVEAVDVGIDWSAQPWGEKNDTEIAKLLGLNPASVSEQRRKRGFPVVRHKASPKGIDWDAQPLGKEPDSVIAKRLVVGRTAVSEQRRKRGIPGYVAPKAPPKARRRRPARDWDAQPLGTMPDVDLAKALGVSAAHVRQAREIRGTAAHPKQGTYSCGACGGNGHNRRRCPNRRRRVGQ